MLVSQVKRLNAVDRLLYWVQEREAIRLKKEAGESKPWTDDWILQSYRFCNVRRMDDKVSRWLLENWYEPYKDHANMVYAAAIARFFNKPTTLEPVTDLVFREGLPDWVQIRETIRKLKKFGPVFNAAYIVSTAGIRSDKIECVLNRYVKPIRLEIVTSSMEKTCESLLKNYGFSDFMAGQVVADLRWAVTGEWKDRMTWAPLGPGSKKGLNLLYGYTQDSHQSNEEFRAMLDDTVELLMGALPKRISRRLEAHDCQNCMCEYSKYIRTLEGYGRPKQLYEGGHA